MSVKEAVKNIRENNLVQMKENFNSAIVKKAVGKLEEKKLAIAKNYFGQEDTKKK